MKIRKTSLIIFGCLASLLCTHAYAEDNKCEAIIRNETIHLTSDSDDGIFYIHMFNGLFPVPTRYSVNIEGTKYLSLTSPPMLNQSNYQSICLSGTIRAGKFSPEVNELTSKFSSQNQYSIHGYNILINPAYRNESDYSIEYDAFIHDEREFIAISDSNKELWKSIFNRHLKNKGLSILEGD